MQEYIELLNGYIKRTSDGVIFPQLVECLEYQEFLGWIAAGNTLSPYEPPTIDPKEQAKADLAASDKEMARIAEDLINIMVNNGLIKKEDLPKPVIAKLESRANLRKVLQADGD